MSDRQPQGQPGQRYDTKDHPLDPPAAPALSRPTTTWPRPPAEGDDTPVEAARVFAVLGLLALALILFIGLMVALRLIVL
jgi:hypothetical protein